MTPKLSQSEKEKRRYDQRYRSQWENNERFAGWLTSCRLDKYYGYCRACKQNVLARLASIKEHAASNKHKKNMLTFSNQPQPDPDQEEQYPPKKPRERPLIAAVIENQVKPEEYYMVVANENAQSNDNDTENHHHISDEEPDDGPSLATMRRSMHRSEDEFEAIGFNVATKLRRLPTPHNIIAEKLISDVLFQAQLGALNHESSIYTPVRAVEHEQRTVVQETTVVNDQGQVVQQYTHNGSQQVCLTIERPVQ